MAERELNAPVRITRNLAADDPGNYSHRDLHEGERLFVFDGCTYGCIDTAVGVACSDKPGENPFFELPLNAVSAVPCTESMP